MWEDCDGSLICTADSDWPAVTSPDDDDDDVDVDVDDVTKR